MGLPRAWPTGCLATADRRIRPDGLPAVNFENLEDFMTSTWGKIKVYTKLSFICLVILAALIFIVSNGQPVTIRFLGLSLTVGAWLLIVLAGLVGIAVFLIVRRISSVLRDFRRIRTESKTRNRNIQATDTLPEQ